MRLSMIEHVHKMTLILLFEFLFGSSFRFPTKDERLSHFLGNSYIHTLLFENPHGDRYGEIWWQCSTVEYN